MGMAESNFFEISIFLHRLTLHNGRNYIFVEILNMRERQCLMKRSDQSGLGMQTVYIFHFSILIRHC